MSLSISYPFDNLPDVVFELIRRVQELGGIATIESPDFNDPGKLQAAQRWTNRMLSAHRSKDQVAKILPYIRWRVKNAA